MLQLNGCNRSVSMDSVGNFAEAVYGIIGKEARLSRAAFRFTINNSRFDGDQTETAFSTSCIVSCGAVAQCAVGIGEVIAHGWNSKAVRNRNGTDLNRLEHSIEFHVYISLLYVRIKVKRRIFQKLLHEAYLCQ